MTSSVEDQKLACKFLKSIFGFKEHTAITTLPLVRMASNFRRTFLGYLPLHHSLLRENKADSAMPGKSLVMSLRRTSKDNNSPTWR